MIPGRGTPPTEGLPRRPRTTAPARWVPRTTTPPPRWLRWAAAPVRARPASPARAGGTSSRVRRRARAAGRAARSPPLPAGPRRRWSRALLRSRHRPLDRPLSSDRAPLGRPRQLRGPAHRPAEPARRRPPVVLLVLDRVRLLVRPLVVTVLVRRVLVVTVLARRVPLPVRPTPAWVSRGRPAPRLRRVEPTTLAQPPQRAGWPARGRQHRPRPPGPSRRCGSGSAGAWDWIVRPPPARRMPRAPPVRRRPGPGPKPGPRPRERPVACWAS